MAENLRTTTYADGTEIPSGLSDEEWSETVEGGFSVHPHDDVEGIDSDEEMVDAYGKLYNWYAVDDERGLCPEGWHVPTAFDFEDLINYLIDSYDNIEYHNIGNSLKSCRQQGSPLGGECDTDQHPRWDYHDTYYGTDEVGFSALPAGSRHSHGGFGENVGIHGRFWNSTDTDPAKAVRWYLEHNSGEVSMGGDVYKEAGLSVRCVKE